MDGVVIRTNSANTTLTVNAQKDTVEHYGNLGKLVLTDIAYDCFYEYGKTAYAEAAKGKIVAKEGGEVTVLYATAPAVAAVKEGGTIGNAYCVSTSEAEAETTGYTNFSNSQSGNVTFEYVDENNVPLTSNSIEEKAQAAVDNNIIKEIEDSGLYEVRIGKVGYETLSDAVDAASTDDTIVLLKDIHFDGSHQVYLWNKDFDLDLNNKTISSISTLESWKSTTICYTPVSSGPNMTVYVKNGRVESLRGAGIYADCAKLTMFIDNVIVEQDSSAYTVSNYSSALRITEGGTIVVNSGSFKGYIAIDMNSSGNTFTQHCIINGGTFDGKLNVSAAGKNLEFVVNGGTFKNTGLTYEQFESYVSSGKTIVVNSDGSWTVTAE